MTQPGNWEPVHYDDLPDGIKKKSTSGRRVGETYTKIFSGKPYDYKVQYAVNQGTLTISYYRTAHRTFTHPSSRIRYLLFTFILAAAGIVILYLFILQPAVPSLIGPVPINTSTVPVLFSPPAEPGNPTPLLTTIPIGDYTQSPRTTTYLYISDGNHGSLRLTTYGGLSAYFSQQNHAFHDDPVKDAIMDRLVNDYQNESIQPFIAILRNLSANPDDQAKIAISLVQHIPYRWNSYYNGSKDLYYPYETLYNNNGDSSDKSLLTAYLLHELGFETAVFASSGYMAVGVKCASNYDYQGTGYAFIETTRPTIISYVPDTYYGGFGIPSELRLIQVNGGKRILDISPEYRDALRLKELEKTGKSMDMDEYNEWLKISNRYDLRYTS
jgi:hypothetical protein